MKHQNLGVLIMKAVADPGGPGGPAPPEPQIWGPSLKIL